MNTKKVKRECSKYINENKRELQRGNHLYRGTDKKYDGKKIVKKNWRKRREVKGGKFLTWVYEFFKPKKYPSREEMVPSVNGGLSGIFSSKNVFVVLPIGDSYFLQYTSGVEDWNSRNYYISSMKYELDALAHNQVIRKERIPDEIKKKTKKALDHYYDSTFSYEDVRMSYTPLWLVLKEAEKYNEDLKEKLNSLKKEIKNYFQETSLSKKLPNEDGLEVNVYAPNGFYYVKESLMEEILN